MAKNEVAKSNNGTPAYSQKDVDVRETATFTEIERETHEPFKVTVERVRQETHIRETRNSKKR